MSSKGTKILKMTKKEDRKQEIMGLQAKTFTMVTALTEMAELTPHTATPALGLAMTVITPLRKAADTLYDTARKELIKRATGGDDEEFTAHLSGYELPVPDSFNSINLSRRRSYKLRPLGLEWLEKTHKELASIAICQHYTIVDQDAMDRLEESLYDNDMTNATRRKIFLKAIVSKATVDEKVIEEALNKGQITVSEVNENLFEVTETYVLTLKEYEER